MGSATEFGKIQRNGIVHDNAQFILVMKSLQIFAIKLCKKIISKAAQSVAVP